MLPSNCALAGTMLPVEYRDMNFLRVALTLMTVGCFLHPGLVEAQGTSATPPFVMDKAYTADLTITTKDGKVIQTATAVDGDKMRGAISLGGMQMTTIVRKDEKKMFAVMDAQKMVMAMDYDPAKFMKGRTAAAFGPTGKFDLLGPDTVDGVACTKYKVTSDDKTQDVYFFWIDTASKIPVEMAAENGAFTVKWKNYKAGPQDPAQFEPPADYQVMAMPNIPGMGGAMGGGGDMP